MDAFDKTEILRALIKILEDVREGWDWSSEVTENTGIFSELGFESIDAVALGAALEEHFGTSLPFAEFLTRAKEQNVTDITVGQLVAFLMSSLNGAAARSLS